mmetsp:Transcript_37710/g.103626  ORF Transcript_37710/g.103626 Transcript_37710/m.103626 type:complete len:543 (+) Transcript_37710:63-1691(+)
MAIAPWLLPGSAASACHAGCPGFARPSCIAVSWDRLPQQGTPRGAPPQFPRLVPWVAGPRRRCRGVHVTGKASSQDEIKERTGEESLQDLSAWRRRELRRIIAFAGPALTIPLADPLMTLIDTICVGRAAGTTHLAALGPNTVIFNFANYGFNFMGIATLSVVAHELAEGRREAATRALGHALALALLLGGALCFLMQLHSSTLLRLAGATPGAPFFEAATAYLRIRALSAPAMLVVVVSQSALLAQGETRDPAVAILAASALNVMGDVLLIAGLRKGAAGAACATLFAEAITAVLLLVALPRNGRLPLRVRVPWMRRDLAPFATVFGPLVVFKGVKNLCYGMLQSTATTLGTVACAGHQAVWVLWTLLSFMPEPLSQAAQSLLPARLVAAQRGGAHERQLLNETLLLLVWLSLLVGLVLSALAWLMPTRLPEIFTSDAALWAPMASVAVPCAVSTTLSSLSCPIEGALLARRDLRYMAGCMVFIFGVLHAGFKRIRSSGAGVDKLPSVWWGLVAFFGLRLMLMAPRLRQKVARRSKERARA